MNVFKDILSLPSRERNKLAAEDIKTVYGDDTEFGLRESNFGFYEYLQGHFTELGYDDWMHGFQRLESEYSSCKPESDEKWLRFAIQMFNIYAMRCFGFTNQRLVYKSLIEVLGTEAAVHKFTLTVRDIVKQEVKDQITHR